MDCVVGERIGLIAGGGRFPIAVAEKLVELGHSVYCLGIKNHYDSSLPRICTEFQEIGVAKIGRQIRFCRRHEVRRATMAGKIFKDKLLYGTIGWVAHLPDWRCMREFYPHFLTRTKDCRDDSLMTTMVEAYAADGILFAPATDFAPELLVKSGTLCGRLSHKESLDVHFGWRMAKEMGRLDVGQSVVVKGQAVIAVEAVEGTDACIRRAGEICKHGGFVVVKVAKPQQDMRFDVPTVGMGTMQTMAQSGGRVLAVEADKTIFIDQDATLQFARKHGITIVALTAEEARVAA